MTARPGWRAIAAGVPRRKPPGRRGDPGLFPPGSVARVVNADTRLLLGGQRALLMQLAHPMVAAGVADHSAFVADPFGRLWNTLDRTLTIAFGDGEARRAAAVRVAATHASVVGVRDGRAYRALDPDLLLWVHATLVDSAIEGYERFVGPLGEGARRRYLREMDDQAVAFGVPRERLWPSIEAFRAYVDATVRELRVSDEARRLGHAVLFPATSLGPRPLVAALRFVTAGILPDPLRNGFGLTWSTERDRGLVMFSTLVRTTWPLLPEVLRRWPQARDADRRLAHT